MKDYIILTKDTWDQSAGDEKIYSWNINSSSFKSMKHNDRVIVKMIACEMTTNNLAVNTSGGLVPLYCNLISSNITTDTGVQILGFVYTDVRVIGEEYFIYTTGTTSDISFYTSPFYNIKIWSDGYPAFVDFTIVLEISYYQN